MHAGGLLMCSDSVLRGHGAATCGLKAPVASPSSKNAFEPMQPDAVLSSQQQPLACAKDVERRPKDVLKDVKMLGDFPKDVNR